MPGNALRFPDRRESAKSAQCRLQLLLVNARDDRLASFTAAGLAATHRVSRDYAEKALTVERERRARG